jgi:hypothetical protein
MKLKELRDWFDKKRLSPLGRALWDALEDEWEYRWANNDLHTRFMSHPPSKMSIAFGENHDQFIIYHKGEGEVRAVAWQYALTKAEQKILLRRHTEWVNKQLAFRFLIAPFKGEQS